MKTAVPRIAVGLVGSCAPALATEAVWRTPADDDDRRLVEALTGVPQFVGIFGGPVRHRPCSEPFGCSESPKCVGTRLVD